MSTFKTGKVRADWVRVFAPELNTLSKKTEYSLICIVDKSDKATITAIANAIKEAIAKENPTGRVAPGWANPLRDGDNEPSKANNGAYKGKYFFRCNKPHKENSPGPGIVNNASMPIRITDPSEFQSGDFCRVSATAQWYEFAGKRGVKFWLNNVQVLEQGDPIGRTTAEQEFAA